MSINQTTQSIRSLLINGTELTTHLSEIRGRQDSITSALSSVSGDYETEIIDGRADAFGDAYANIGNNIRVNQTYLYQEMKTCYDELRTAYNNLAIAFIELAGTVNRIIGDDE